MKLGLGAILWARAYSRVWQAYQQVIRQVA
jgi:hypothetical protein